MTLSDETTRCVRDESDGFYVRTRAYVDGVIYARELERIFESSWIYLAHESEVANPGDYVTAWIGRQPVIVVRAKDGELLVHVNACRHRGTVLCREERGSATNFRCPYHGWTYAADGRLIGITDRKQYPEDIAQQIGGLLRVPRVGTCRGLIFASLCDDVPSLDDHLGPIRHQIELWADGSPGGEYVVRRPHRFRYAGNWKYQVENTVDGYHPRFVHESGFKALRYRPGAEPAGADFIRNLASDLGGCTRGFVGGHATLERLQGPDLPMVGLTVFPPVVFDSYMRELVERHGAERAEELRVNRFTYVFPNLFLMDINLRVVHPLAPDDTEVTSYFLEAQGVASEVNRYRLRDLEARLGTTGMVGSDDLEIFARCQTGISAGRPEWLVFSRGMEAEQALGGCELVGNFSSETPQRSFWRQWSRLVDLEGASA